MPPRLSFVDNSDRTQTDGDDMRPRGTLDESRPPPYVPPPAPEGDDLFKQASTGINFNKYDDIPVRLTGREPVSPVSSFDEANLNATIAENVRKSGYKKPTPVQKYAMPCILSGRDLMACAQTGSGKTVRICCCCCCCWCLFPLCDCKQDCYTEIFLVQQILVVCSFSWSRVRVCACVYKPILVTCFVNHDNVMYIQICCSVLKFFSHFKVSLLLFLFLISIGFISPARHVPDDGRWYRCQCICRSPDACCNYCSTN